MSNLGYLQFMDNITDKTKISLFAAMCSMPFVIGAAIWMTEVDARASQAAEKAMQAQFELVGLKALAVDIRERQIRMEQMVQDLTDKRRK